MTPIERVKAAAETVERVIARRPPVIRPMINQIANIVVPWVKENIDLIGTGCTILNLALSGKGKGGIARNRVFNLVGKESSGKSLVALEILYWAMHHLLKITPINFPRPESYRLRYNNVEGVMDFPIEDMYPGLREEVEWERSATIEHFSRDFGKFCKELRSHTKPSATGKSQVKSPQAGIYVLDSWDPLTTESLMKEMSEAEDKGREKEGGTYGTEKVRYASSTFFRKIVDAMDGVDITLIIISQVRMNLQRKTKWDAEFIRTGGKAFDHMVHQECWLYDRGMLKDGAEEDSDKKLSYGKGVRCYIKKNKVATPYREAMFDILFDHGIDDVGSMMSWMFGPKKAKIPWEGENFEREDFIHFIEDNCLEDKLIAMVEARWKLMEENVKKTRKPKYGDAC